MKNNFSKKYKEWCKKNKDCKYMVPLKSDLEKMGFKIHECGKGVDFFDTSMDDIIITNDENNLDFELHKKGITVTK